MSEQEQPFDKWHTKLVRYVEMGWWPSVADTRRFISELRQRDEELELLRAEMERRADVFSEIYEDREKLLARMKELEKEIDGIYEDAAGASI